MFNVPNLGTSPIPMLSTVFQAHSGSPHRMGSVATFGPNPPSYNPGGIWQRIRARIGTWQPMRY
jgi:hypothetical protein